MPECSDCRNGLRQLIHFRRRRVYLRLHRRQLAGLRRDFPVQITRLSLQRRNGRRISISRLLRLCSVSDVCNDEIINVHAITSVLDPL